nr:hypothetical protein CFP56_43969 [Quercus suber]
MPPPADLVKINFDGATCSGTNKSGLSVVIRDSMGQVLASCSKMVNQAHSSSEVEAMAAGLALSFAAELGHEKCGFGRGFIAGDESFDRI